MSLQSLVTHDDPITTTMPVAGSVEVGMSTSKEVKARMTSLGKQTDTPHGWGGRRCSSAGLWEAVGEKADWEEGGQRKKETLVYRSRGSGNGRETILFRNDRSQAGRGRQRKRCLAEEKNQKISKG